VVVVAFGDSVTMGSTANGLFIPEDVYHSRLKKMFAEKFPGAAAATLSVINAGIGGDTATAALGRLERDVIRHQPDLVLVAFAANDLSFEPASADAFENSTREILGAVRAKTPADIILLTSTHMAGRENDNTTDKGFLRVLMRFQNEGVVERYANIVRRIGREENVPVADVYAKWDELAAAGVDTTAMLANGLNHPTAEAHAIHAAAVFEIISASLSADAENEGTANEK
jgi:lysophospholipase L1-like esterase